MNPIVLPHNPQWKTQFNQERDLIAKALRELARKIEHIGSTSIPGILAKPIIDILIEVPSLDKLDQSSSQMESLGYEAMGEFGIETRRYFRKTNASGMRTHHVHVFQSGSPHLIRHRAFRDYLIAFPDFAQEYSSLKQELVKLHPRDIEAYMDGKSPFIVQTEANAIDWYENR